MIAGALAATLLHENIRSQRKVAGSRKAQHFDQQKTNDSYMLYNHTMLFSGNGFDFLAVMRT
jgi:hypothetical protein